MLEKIKPPSVAARKKWISSIPAIGQCPCWSYFSRTCLPNSGCTTLAAQLWLDNSGYPR